MGWDGEGVVKVNTKTNRRQMRALGDEAAAHIRAVLPEALGRYRRVIVLTHVAPWPEASWFMGRMSEPEWLPLFVCKALGDVLLDAMRSHPDREMTVLCGHTHGSGEAAILPNLRALTGGARYGHPMVQDVLGIE